MDIDIISLLLEPLPRLVVVFLVYTYLLYVALFKKGKFSSIKNLEEIGKLIILFTGLFILIISIVYEILFVSNIMFSTPLPTDLTLDMESIIFSILAFVFLPYMMKKEADKKKKKFDLGDWYFFILLLDLWIIIFSLVSLSYVAFFLHSSQLTIYFLGIVLFTSFLFLLCLMFLKVVLTHVFKLRKRKYFDKKIWKLIAFQLIISITALVIYILF